MRHLMQEAATSTNASLQTLHRRSAGPAQPTPER